MDNVDKFLESCKDSKNGENQEDKKLLTQKDGLIEKIDVIKVVKDGRQLLNS